MINTLKFFPHLKFQKKKKKDKRKLKEGLKPKGLCLEGPKKKEKKKDLYSWRETTRNPVWSNTKRKILNHQEFDVAIFHGG